MIIKIGAGGGTAGGLVSYMASKGHKNEHVNQRTIAGGSVYYPGSLDRETVKQVTADLQLYQDLYPDVKVNGGAVWQCSIAVKPEEGPISDETWGALATDFMQGMGFVGDGKPDVRWAIFGHGESVNGNPHCHIIMHRINADGKKVNTYKDMIKAQLLAPDLEVKYGLKVLESRLSPIGAGSVPITSADIAVARRTGSVEPDRVALERRLRAAAVTSDSEAEFIRRVRTDGLAIRPYPVESGAVMGYSVGLRSTPDVKQSYFAAGSVARDLTLPQLRRSWSDTPGTTALAEAEWRVGTKEKPHNRSGRETQPVSRSKQSVNAVTQELTAVAERLKVATPLELVEISHDLAGTLAAASQVLEKTPGPLAKASREVGAWAQTAGHGTAKRAVKSSTRGAALLLIQALDPTGPMGQAIMLRQMVETMVALHRLHQATRSMAGTERKRIMAQGEVDGIDDMTDTAVTMGVTIGGRAVQNWAESKAARMRNSGDTIVSDREWASMDARQREQVTGPPPTPQQQAADKARRTELWSAKTIRRDRAASDVEAARRAFSPPPPRATRDQVERVEELAARAGLPGVGLAAAGMSEAEVAAIIKDMEVTTEGLVPPVEPVLSDHTLQSATGLGEIRTPDDAEAFLARLERKAGPEAVERINQSIEFKGVVDGLKTPAAQVAQEPALPNAKDPRTWATASEPVSKRQHYTLSQGGLSEQEIASIKGKGEASYIIGATGPSGTIRDSFERAKAEGTTAPPARPEEAARQASAQQPTTRPVAPKAQTEGQRNQNLRRKQ